MRVIQLSVEFKFAMCFVFAIADWLSCLLFTAPLIHSERCSGALLRNPSQNQIVLIRLF